MLCATGMNVNGADSLIIGMNCAIAPGLARLGDGCLIVEWGRLGICQTEYNLR